MKRFVHYLKGNLSSESPHLLAYLDTETDQKQRDSSSVTHHLKFGWLCSERSESHGRWDKPQWFRFETPDELWDIVESLVRPKTKLYLFVHNWVFDGMVLKMFKLLPARGWKMTRAIVDKGVFIVRWRQGNRTVLCLDTGNWFKHSLEKLGEHVGIAKLPMPSKTASLEEWDIYCRRDVEVVRQAVRFWLRFVKENDLGGVAPTLASQAFKAFRHRFMKDKILIDDDDRSQELARESYSGGRVEAFRIGKVEGPIYCFDVNSMYPSVMKSNLYPRERFSRSRHVSVADLREWLKRSCLVALVFIEITEPRYCLKRDGKLIFPVGSFWVTLTTPDLITALERNEIRACKEAVIYDWADIFSGFVTELYGLRLEAKVRGNDILAWQIKLLLNGLYGKFGQKGTVWETIKPIGLEDGDVCLHIDLEKKTMTRVRCFGGVTQELQAEVESRESFPAIAAHVTAEARKELWRLMTLAGRENVFYVDTDSLYVNQTGADRLSSEVHPDRLGALKLEGTYSDGWIHGAKDYVFGNKRTCKGIKKNAVELSPGVFRQEQWPRFAGLLEAGSLDAPITKTIIKRLSRSYDKGIIGSTGLVSPFRLTDG